MIIKSNKYIFYAQAFFVALLILFLVLYHLLFASMTLNVILLLELINDVLKKKKYTYLQFGCWVVIYYVAMCFLLLLIFNIFIPAHYSLVQSCLPKDVSSQILRNAGYYTTGSAVATLENNTIKNITITTSPKLEDYPKEKLQVLKHEYCHKKQMLKDTSISCNKPQGMYLKEVECYIAQYMPDVLYEKLYYKIKEIEK